MSQAKGARQPSARGAAPLDPLGLCQSLLFFGLPTLVAFFGFYFIMPALIDGGILPFFLIVVPLLL